MGHDANRNRVKPSLRKNMSEEDERKDRMMIFVIVSIYSL